ncbi:kinase-like domain-containing protein [Tanacetum coccineum]
MFYGLAIICLTSSTVSASYGGNETDYHALMSFKSMITHDPYQVLASWNHSFHFWSGISCGKRHKRVIVLRLNSQGLEGSLSPHVGNLSFLRELYLKNNSFQETIPRELGRLSRLRRLYLDENNFSGIIPPNLWNPTFLGEYHINGNVLCCNEPAWWEHSRYLGSLEKLDGIPFCFHGRGEANDMTFIDSLKNCTRLHPFRNASDINSLVGLTDVDSLDNQFKGKIPTTIGKLQNLQYLALAENQFSGLIPDAIGNLSLLIELLYSNKLAGHIPSSLGKCKELTVLSLRDNRLGGKIPKQSFQLPSLSIGLDLSQNSLSGSIPLDIKDLNMLNILDLSSNNLSGTITSSLGECVCLTILNLQGNQFQGIIPSSISSLRGLV